jgi:hypothetical protein
MKWEWERRELPGLECKQKLTMQYSDHCSPSVRATKKAQYGRRARRGAHAVETRDRDSCRGIYRLSLARSGQDEGGRVEEI